MKKAILAVYTGSSHPESEKAYNNIEAEIKKKLPDTEFRTLDPRELVMTPFSFSNSLISQNKIGAGIFHFRFVQAYQ